MRGNFRFLKNDHGVALIIVLLVTALLIALIFEFAYSTRVSLHAAVNFRDSQRAYFLARSGMNYFIRYPGLKNFISQGTLTPLPLFSGNDTVFMEWEDEAGKINVINFYKNKVPTYEWVVQLFDKVGVSQEVLDKIVDTNNPKIQMLSDLHKYMSDGDYIKVAPFLTANTLSGDAINVNTASEIVLRITQPSDKVDDILAKRRDQKDASSPVNKIFFSATVGGYTKQITAITNGTAFDYWTSQ
jgi:type II secretory pathway component PulK